MRQIYHKFLLSPATSSYINSLRVSVLISSTKNDQQGAVQDASWNKKENKYHPLKCRLALKCTQH